MGGSDDHVHADSCVHEPHGHHHHRHASRRALLLVLVLTACYMTVEAIGGFLTNSLALLADAGHMFTDVAALSFSYGAMWLAAQPPTPKRSFGFYRFEILAALLNGSLLIVVSVGILWEGVQRLMHPSMVQGLPMMAIAAGGLAVNLMGAAVLMRSAHDNLNARGALLHVIGDALGSLGAVVAAALIYLRGWTWADAVCSGFVGILVLRSAWHLVMESVDVLLQNTPLHIDPAEVVHALEEQPEVASTHDLHIWTVSSGMVSLTCHVVMHDPFEPMTLLHRLQETLAERFGIDHATLQFETADCGHCQRLHW